MVHTASTEHGVVKTTGSLVGIIVDGSTGVGGKVPVVGMAGVGMSKPDPIPNPDVLPESPLPLLNNPLSDIPLPEDPTSEVPLPEMPDEPKPDLDVVISGPDPKPERTLDPDPGRKSDVMPDALEVESGSSVAIPEPEPSKPEVNGADPDDEPKNPDPEPEKGGDGAPEAIPEPSGNIPDPEGGVI